MKEPQIDTRPFLTAIIWLLSALVFLTLLAFWNAATTVHSVNINMWCYQDTAHYTHCLPGTLN